MSKASERKNARKVREYRLKQQRRDIGHRRSRRWKSELIYQRLYL